MADYDSSLPIRSEADGTDERVHVKVVDGTTPSQRMIVDTDGNAHVELHGNDSGGTDRVVKLSESGNVALNGDYDVSTNSNPSSSALIAHDRGASIDETSQNKRVTAVAGADNTVCLDIALRDESGVAFSATNPLPVALQQSEGTEVHDYDTAAAVASDATSNHDYSVANGVTFELREIWASASGKMKIEVQIGDGGVTEVFSSVFVGFNSTANPNIKIDFPNTPISVVGTANNTTVRIIRTNLDNQAQDLYSTIIGLNQ